MNDKDRKALVYLAAFILVTAAAGISNVLPISVVSVQEMGPPVPAGPTIKVTLKSNSTVTKLSATLTIINASPIVGGGSGTFDFPDINQSNPLMPGQTTWQTLIFVSANYDPNDTYPLLIEGMLQNGQTFSYMSPVMITQPMTSTPAPTPLVIKGDVNGDNQITTVDALLIAQYTVGMKTLSASQLAAADVNNDGQVTIVDALFIAQYTVGTRTL